MADVRFGAHSGPNSDIAWGPKSARSQRRYADRPKSASIKSKHAGAGEWLSAKPSVSVDPVSA